MAALVALCAAVASCTSRQCCVDSLPASYGRVYGVVRSSSQAPLQNILVQAEGSGGVLSDSVGHYALDVTVRARPGSTVRLPIRATRLTSSGAVADSAWVTAPITVYAQQPVLDSAQANITLSATP
ncbi:MAG: hypothetical protein HOQ09_03510 [Gemmatimonadaceae bacterium]|nr:hypothetical protein [Gemmatimonadaceae bacterium]